MAKRRLNKSIINILGINISTLDKNKLKKKLIAFLHSDEQFFVTTPNPEIILKANRDEEYHYILNQADLSVADGVGLKFASWLLAENIHRWPGSLIVLYLLSFAEKNNIKVAILNWKNGLSSAEEIKIKIKKDYPALDFIVEDAIRDWSLNYYEKLNIFKPDIIFVCFGSPYQEKFIWNNKEKFPYTKLLMGVGGSFDYISGKVKMTPGFFSFFGIEWIWRILNIFSFDRPIERLKRIFRAVFVFSFSFLKWRFYNPLVYRKNVGCLLFKRVDNKYYIVLIRSIKGKRAWQIPQGGTEGQSLENAARRELQEELGTYKFRILKSYKNIHKYKFPKKVDREFRNYRGQSQGLVIAEYTGRGKEIKTNYWEYDEWKWVEVDEVCAMVEEVRQNSMRKFLEKFKAEIVDRGLSTNKHS